MLFRKYEKMKARISFVVVFFFQNHFWEPKHNKNARVRSSWHWAGTGRWGLCQDWPGDCSVDGTVFSRSWLPQTNGFLKILSFPFKMSCQIFTVSLASFHVKPTSRSGTPNPTTPLALRMLFVLLQHEVPGRSQPPKLRWSWVWAALTEEQGLSKCLVFLEWTF